MVPLGLTGALLVCAALPVGLFAQGTWGAFMAVLPLGLGMTVLAQFLSFQALPEGRPQERGVLWGSLLLSCLGAVAVCAALVFYNRESVPFVALVALGGSAMMLGTFTGMGRLSKVHVDLPPAPSAPGWPRLLLGGLLGGGSGLFLAWLGVDPADSEPLSLAAQSQLSACLSGDCAGLRAGGLGCGEIADVAGQLKRAAHLQSQPNTGFLAALLLLPFFLVPFAFLERRYPRISNAWSFPLMAGLVLWAGYTAGAGHQMLSADLVEANMTLRAACVSCSGVDRICDGPWPDVPDWRPDFP